VGRGVEWVYTADPLRLVRLEGQQARANGALPESPGWLYGSSQALRLERRWLPEGGWLWVDHEVAPIYPRMYVHRLVVADPMLERVTHMSEPLYFEKLGIEFCCGAAVDGEQLVLSYGAMDRQAKLAFVPLERALGLLEEIS
jgi:hypothetical protein